MLPAIILTAIVAFIGGWVLKDQKWVSAAKKGKIMVVDGNMYKVKQYTETHGGSVEE